MTGRQQVLDKVLQLQSPRSRGLAGHLQQQQRREKKKGLLKKEEQTSSLAIVRKAARRAATRVRGLGVKNQIEKKEKSPKPLTKKVVRRRDALDHATELAYRGRKTRDPVGYPLSESAASNASSCLVPKTSFLSTFRRITPPPPLSSLTNSFPDKEAEETRAPSQVSIDENENYDDDDHLDDSHPFRRCGNFNSLNDQRLTRTISVAR